MNKQLLVLFTFILTYFISHAQPASFQSMGIGGGGAMFALSINPNDSDEYYASCDMGELFHTTDFGLSYSQNNHLQFRGGHNSKVEFTATPGLIYSISYKDDLVRPVKSLDHGITWQNLVGDPDPYETTYSIFVDYVNSNRIFIAHYNRVYYSSNGGQTFVTIHNALNSGTGVVVSGALFDGNSMYLGTSDGVLASTNGGTSWAIANISGIPSNQRIWSFTAAKSGNITRFYCITADVGDVYPGVVGSDYWGFAKGIYTVDYGITTWVSKTNGIQLASDFPMFIDMAANDINTVYLAGSNSQGYPTIIKTSNGGNLWSHVFLATTNQNIKTGWSGDGGDRNWGYGECAFGLEVSPNNLNKVIFGDYGFVHKTSDGGTTWAQAYLNDGDENTSGNNTPKYRYYQSCGLENTTSWQVFWIDSLKLWSCYSDIRGMKSNDGGYKWSFDYTGHTANSSYRVVKKSNGHLFAATSNIHDIYQSTYLTDARLDGNDANGKIIYSLNNGNTWQNLKVFNHPVYWLVIDPNNENRAYASVIHYGGGSGVGGVYFTNDLQNLSASTWTLLPNPPRTEKHPAALVVLNDGKLVASYSGRRNGSGTFTPSSGVFLYDPIANTWADKSHSGMYYWTRDVIIDPNDVGQNTWYACVYSGWGGAPNGLGGLYKSNNRGDTWTKLTANLLDRVASCTFNPSNSNEIFIITEVQGLWKSNNINHANPTFSQVVEYPFQQPERVFFNPYDAKEMWVSSFGNGMKKGIIHHEDCTHVSNKKEHGKGSLIYAVECALLTDTITFESTIAGDTIYIGNAMININKNLHFINTNPSKVYFKGDASVMLKILQNNQCSFENIGLISENTSYTTIVNDGDLLLKNATFESINSPSILINKGSVQAQGQVIIK